MPSCQPAPLNIQDGGEVRREAAPPQGGHQGEVGRGEGDGYQDHRLQQCQRE